MQTMTRTSETTVSTPEAHIYPDRSDLPEMLGMFALIHDAMRRDAERLVPAAAAVVTSGDAAALMKWWQPFAEAIVHHHEREDDNLWPDLRERDPGFAADELALRDDHLALDAAMERMSTCLAVAAASPVGTVVDNAGLIEAASEFCEIIWGHLAREEAAAFGRIERTYTPDEYRAIERQFTKGTSLSAMAFVVPWVLGGGKPTPEQKKAAPAVVRILYCVFWRSSYARLSAPLTATG